MEMKKNSVSKKRCSSSLYYVSKRVGQAIADYDMLQSGDRILVAVSGGTDSLSLCHVLRHRQEFIPVSVEIRAVYVDNGLPGVPVEALEAFFREWQIPYHIERTGVFEDKTWEDIDCYICSRERRKALFSLADRLGYNKIALGHHLDDIAETILLNLFYRAEVGAMCPRQELFDGKITIIRPLAYVTKKDIQDLISTEEIPVFDQGVACPREEISRRALMQKILQQVEESNPQAKGNLLRSLRNIKKDYLL